ncbi:MAG: glycosyltransferase [Roseburia sp.]|nr:glycosyltransferase [Roseburia sp.]
MRIAMLTNNYKPYVGGVPISIEHLADALRRRGHTVYVFAPSYPNEEEEPYVIRYPSFPVQIAGAPVPNVLTGLIRKLVKMLEIDVLHVHHPALVGNVAYILRRELGIPVVFTYHTRYEEYLYYVKPLKALERCTGVIERYLRWYCGRCDMLLAPTREIQEHLRYEKGAAAPIEILPTGLPAESFAPDREEAARIRERYCGAADWLFCTTARLAKEKNLDFLFESLQRIKAAMEIYKKKFRYLIIGEGPDRRRLEEKRRRLGLEQEIVFVGAVANSRIKEYMAASDLFLFSSKSETQGIVMLEAMAAGTPVIAVAATGVRDIVRSDENGILTAEDGDDFARAVEAALRSPQAYERLCRGAEETAAAYTEEKIAAMAERCYLAVQNNCQSREIHAILKPN